MLVSRRITCLQAMLIVLVVGGVYGPSLRAPFIFDDNHAIEDNSHIRRLWPLQKSMAAPPQSPISGRPAVAFTLAINYAMGGLNPFGYHLFNTIIHALCGCLLLGVTRRAFESSGFHHLQTWMAFTLTLIWTVHPLQTETVIYTTQRTELIMALFYLLTVYCCQRGWTSPYQLGWFSAAVGACALGMASKEVMVSAPLAVLLYDRAFVSGTFRAACRSHWPLYVGLAATWVILALLMMNFPRSRSVGFGHETTAWQYLLTQAGVIVWYLRLCVWPAPLSIHHQWPIVDNLAQVWLAALVVLTLLGVTCVAIWRRPQLGFLGASFFLILAPTSSFVPIITEVVAERRMYLPLAAVIVTIGFATNWTFGTIGRRGPLAGALAAVIVAGVLARTSIHRLNDYGSKESIWQSVFEVYEDNPWALTGLGLVEAKHDQLDDAMAYYHGALELDPSFVRARVNLAIALLRLDRIEEAEATLRDARELDPQFVPIYTNLGIALVRQDKLDEAVEVLRHALLLDPGAVKVHNNLGAALQRLRQLGEAASCFERALALDPDFVPARENLLALHNRLGATLARNGHFDQAVGYFRILLRAHPDNTKVRKRLAACLYQADRTSEAIDEFERLLDHDPNDGDTHRRLALAFVAKNEPKRAVHHLQESLRLNPEDAEAKDLLDRIPTSDQAVLP